MACFKHKIQEFSLLKLHANINSKPVKQIETKGAISIRNNIHCCHILTQKRKETTLYMSHVLCPLWIHVSLHYST